LETNLLDDMVLKAEVMGEEEEGTLSNFNGGGVE
jgi:hypothetical protein